MTPTESAALRQEAERVAIAVLTTRQDGVLRHWHPVALAALTNAVTDALVAFAQRERLRGMIEACERGVHGSVARSELLTALRAELKALEKGEEVAG